MRNYLIHLALAFTLVATYAVAQQSGAAPTPSDGQAQQPSATAPAAQGQQGQQPSASTPSQEQQNQQPSTSGQPGATPSSQSGAGASASQPAGQAGQGGPKADAIVQDEIQQAFRTEPSLANKVTVNVANNQVVLSGTVLTPAEKKTAQQVAEAYANGTPVVNNVNVSSSTSAAAAASGMSNPTAGQAQPPAAGAAQSGTAGGISGAAAGQAQPPAGAQAGAAGAVGTQSGAAGAQTGAAGASSQQQGAQPSQSAPAEGGLTTDHLRTDIQNALQRDPTVAPCNLTTNVTAEAVELAGTCPTAQGKQTAVRLAQSFAGNRRVVDRITLSGGSQGSTPPPR